jgi:rhodanese-related sulfurtransferase
VDTLTGHVPARPLNITAIEATNRGRADLPWAMLTVTAPVAEVGVEELAARPAGAFLLDVREPEEYAHGHAPGAISIPQADLATRLAEVPRDRPVFVICQGGVRSLRAAQFLKQVGIADVVSVRGGTEAWRQAGKPVDFGDRGLAAPRIAESEWAHAGVLSYQI